MQDIYFFDIIIISLFRWFVNGFCVKNRKIKENVEMVTLLEVIIAKLKKMTPEELHEVYAYIRRMKNK